jgi:hypothetical protein
MTTETMEELTAVLGLLISNGDISLEDILRAAADAVAETEGVRHSVVVSRVHSWAHCIRAQMDAGIKGEG